jgi:hypothetical protein
VGGNFGIGGINPNLLSPKANIWSATVEEKIGRNFAASVGYSGSHSYNLVGGGNQAGLVSYGQDINAFAGDLFTKPAPSRLNSSFGSIAYAANDRYSNYESVFFDFKGRFSRRGFIDASYTRSESKDDASVYPAEATPSRYYGPSPWDVPNRFSLTFNYELPGLDHGAAGFFTSGWGASGTSIYQTGYPAMVTTTAPFLANCANGNLNTAAPYCSASNPAVSYAPGSGDYNADGDNADYPDVASYHQGNSKSAFLNGVFSSGQFGLPATFGNEGNENANQFRQPNFIETDMNIYKVTRIAEGVDFQVRFEFFNIFNRVNLTGFDSNLADSGGNFGKATSQQLPRNWQLGGRFTF